jgi:serine/threonine-protein kinase
LARYPDAPAFLSARALALFQMGRLDEAERTFRLVIRLQPGRPLAYANLSAVLLRAGRLEASLAVVQEGLRHGPDARLYSNLGNLLFRLRRYPEAAQAFERAVSDERGSPNHYLKWANLADTLRWLPGRQHDAQAAYKRALHGLEGLLQAQDPTVLSRAALYHARRGDTVAALPLATRARALATRSPDVLYRVALVHELAHRREEALAALREALRAGYPRAEAELEPDLLALRRSMQWQQLITQED